MWSSDARFFRERLREVLAAIVRCESRSHDDLRYFALDLEAAVLNASFNAIHPKATNTANTPAALASITAAESMLEVLKANHRAREAIAQEVYRRWPPAGRCRGSIESAVRSPAVRKASGTLGPLARELGPQGWAAVVAAVLDQLLDLYEELYDEDEPLSAEALVRTAFTDPPTIARLMATWSSWQARERCGIDWGGCRDPWRRLPEERRAAAAKMTAVLARQRNLTPAVLLRLVDLPQPPLGTLWLRLVEAWALGDWRKLSVVRSMRRWPAEEWVFRWLVFRRQREAMELIVRRLPLTAGWVLQRMSQLIDERREATRGKSYKQMQSLFLWTAKQDVYVWPALALVRMGRAGAGGLDGGVEQDRADRAGGGDGRLVVAEERLVAAFRQAEEQLGTSWRLKGRMHDPRATLPPHLAELVAARTVCVDYVTRSGGELRRTSFYDGLGQRSSFSGWVFPAAIVRRAAEIIGIPGEAWPSVRLAGMDAPLNGRGQAHSQED